MSVSPDQDLHWQDLSASKVRIYFLSTRPKFFTASVLPVLLGTAWGYSRTGHLDSLSFLLAIVAIICVHACINVLNDVYDDRNGTDRINTGRIFPFSGGSRFIQEGVLSQQDMYRWGLALGSAASLMGLVLTLREGLPVLWLGLAGLALGVLYSAPPLALAGRGLGELAVAVGTGLLPVIGSAWLQTHTWEAEVLLLAVPVSIWVGCILLINEIPDRDADGASGKRTLVVRFGVTAALWLYVVVNSLALASLFLMIYLGMARLYILLLPGLLFLFMLATVYQSRDIPQSEISTTRLIKLTLMIHTLGSIWLTASIII